MRRSYAALALAAVTLTVAACGDAAEPEKPAAKVAAAIDAYTAGSDVTAHAAIGGDADEIRDLLAVAKDGKAVDWAAVQKVVSEGGASKKGDGFRTLGALADKHPATEVLTAALTGGATDAVRAQQVDKTITVILADKVLGELDAAAAKVEKKELDVKTGAAHNVDEAWAFFTAQDQGPALTADKRAKDFAREGKVREPVVIALQAAQSAAVAGDSAALEKATADVRSGLDYVFYLATYKYLDHASDAVKKAEGETFYLGRAALNSPEVLTALGIDDVEQISG